jgi:hypothetical protein
MPVGYWTSCCSLWFGKQVRRNLLGTISSKFVTIVIQVDALNCIQRTGQRLQLLVSQSNASVGLLARFASRGCQELRYRRRVVYRLLFSVQVGAAEFGPLLMRVIYPLIERVSDHAAEVCLRLLSNIAHCKVFLIEELPQVSDAALRALHDVAVTMVTKGEMVGGTTAITILLRDNMDYIVDAIASRMRNLHEHPQTPGVLAVIMRFTGPDIIPLIDDTVSVQRT